MGHVEVCDCVTCVTVGRHLSRCVTMGRGEAWDCGTWGGE